MHCFKWPHPTRSTVWKLATSFIKSRVWIATSQLTACLHNPRTKPCFTIARLTTMLRSWMTTILRLRLSPVGVFCASHVTSNVTLKRKHKAAQQPGLLAEDVYAGQQLREPVLVTCGYIANKKYKQTQPANDFMNRDCKYLNIE